MKIINKQKYKYIQVFHMFPKADYKKLFYKFVTILMYTLVANGPHIARTCAY
jgi:hypothetical protein